MDTKVEIQRETLESVKHFLEWTVEHAGEYRLVRGRDRAKKALKSIEAALASVGEPPINPR